jgi:acyl carrier protein
MLLSRRKILGILIQSFGFVAATVFSLNACRDAEVSKDMTARGKLGEDPILLRVKKSISAGFGGRVKVEEITDEARFIEDLGADSLRLVELIMAFEEEFNLEIPDEDANKIKSVNDAVAYLKVRSHQPVRKP